MYGADDMKGKKGSLGKLSNCLCQKDWLGVEVKADDNYDGANEEGECNSEKRGFGVCTDNSECVDIVIVIRLC